MVKMKSEVKVFIYYSPETGNLYELTKTINLLEDYKLMLLWNPLYGSCWISSEQLVDNLIYR